MTVQSNPPVARTAPGLAQCGNSLKKLATAIMPPYLCGTGLFINSMLRRFLSTVVAAFAGGLSAVFWAFANATPSSPALPGNTLGVIVSITLCAWLFVVLPIGLAFHERRRIYNFEIAIPLGAAIAVGVWVACCLIAAFFTKGDLLGALKFAFHVLSSWVAWPILSSGVSVALTLSLFAHFYRAKADAHTPGA